MNNQKRTRLTWNRIKNEFKSKKKNILCVNDLDGGNIHAWELSAISMCKCTQKNIYFFPLSTHTNTRSLTYDEFTYFYNELIK